MKTGLPLLLLLVLLLDTRAPAARAQAPAEAAEAAAARAGLERKALGLVEAALAEAQSLRLPENRVRAQAAAARVLWPRDEEAARAAFRAAAAGVAETSAAVDPEDPQFYNAAQVILQLRTELVYAAAPFDASLALEFLRATRPPYAEALAAAGFTHPSQERALEMNIAGYLLTQEPRRALEIVEESLGKGVTMSVLNILQQLGAKDPAAAARLAAAIVRRLSPEDLRSQSEAAQVAQQLLMLTRAPENPPANGAVNSTGTAVVLVGRGTPNPVGPALLDEQARRELVEKVLAALASAAPNRGGAYGLHQAFQTLLPELERTAPARVAALRRRADELERSLNLHVRQMSPYQELMQTGTVEAVLEAAGKAPAEVRDQLYAHAAWKAFNEGDADRARQVLENISNPQQRAQARRDMEQRAHWRSVQQGDYREARLSVSRLKTPEDRVQALLQIASRAADARDAETARQVLDEARGLVESQTRGHQQFGYRLQVANAYARFDADASFGEVEGAVGRLDALMDAAETLDGFGHESFREGELKPQGGYMWNEMINQCAQALALLAKEDFERAAAAAKKFRRPEARVSAQLTLAQNLLGSVAPGQEFRQQRRGIIKLSRD